MTGKRVGSWGVTDEVWRRVEPLIPRRAFPADKKHLRKPGAGRAALRRGKHLCADAGYRSAENLRVIEEHGYTAHVVDRREEADIKRRDPKKKARRWVVEVRHGWFNRFRKLQLSVNRIYG